MLDYRKVTGTRAFRQKILSLMTWLPDTMMLRIQYFIQTGKMLHLKHPQKLGEFIQAYKLFYHNPVMQKCVDKFEVRKFIEERGLKNILVPLIGVYNNAGEIDLEKLPEKFIMKTTDGGGNNEIFICRDKNNLQEKEFKSEIEKWLKSPKPKKHIAREWAYDNNFPRRIIIEELLEESSGAKDIDDFKFFCYDGKFKVLEWHKDRSTAHKAGHYDENLKFKPHVKIYPTPFQDYKLPDNIKEMVSIAEKLSEGFPFVRVDLYNVDGKIFFGEMTFYPASGYFVYHPKEENKVLGSFFKYPFLSK